MDLKKGIKTIVLSLAFSAAFAGAAFGYTKAVTYFGDEWATNFWSCEHSQADADFAMLRDDGFNTVIFCVPWREFQPDNGKLNEAAFAKLDEMMTRAGSCGLDVMLRVGYTWDYQGRGNVLDRFEKAITKDGAERKNWLAYCAALYQRASAHSNYAGGFITWEDFWNALFCFGSGEQCFRGYDAALTELLTQSQSVYPNLSMECRWDADPCGNTVYPHTETFSCGASGYSSGMLAVTMGWTGGQTIDAARGAAGSSQVIQAARSYAGKPIFVDQFLYQDNSPSVANLPKLAPDQVNAYLSAMGGVFREQTIGYGLWGHKDYVDNLVNNPEFGYGTGGWDCTGTVSVETVNGSKKAVLEKGAVLRQKLVGRGFISQKATKMDMEVICEEPATLSLNVGGISRRVKAEPGSQIITVNFGRNVADSVSISTDQKIIIDNVKVYSHVTSGGIYNKDGTPGPNLPGVRAMNAR